ncbi:hypothetical protein [Aliidiomarina quisquiliarum]|uniref:hypothetical protein n=1 Tax=Aliidiomarina quisquiliarum TaxID=2938947 RepID=UPI00208ECC29|nr:hypothetical protein [Aliidiomarina quisquiliarum]MCO4320009.1 hypothetical protein [Aliidiomarina quisquiliarum]
MKSSRLKRLSRIERLELAQRHFEGSKTSALKKRFRVSETDIETVIRDFKRHKLMKRHRQWQPHWDHPDIVRHPIGKDALRALKAGQGDDLFLSPLDPNLDIANGLYHLTWSKQDIDDLLYGMLKRCFAILKEGRPTSEEFKEEAEFINSDLFFAICSHLGLDGDDLKSTFDYKCRRQAQLKQH